MDDSKVTNYFVKLAKHHTTRMFDTHIWDQIYRELKVR